MIRVAIVGAWPGLVVAAGWRLAPRRRPVVDAVPPPRAPARSATRARAGRVAIIVIAVAAFVMVAPVLAPVPLVLAVVQPRLQAHRAQRRAEAEVLDDLPDVVELLVLAAGAGLTAVLAAEAVGRRAPGPVGAALAGAHRRIELGQPPVRAFHELDVATAVPDAVRPLGRALATAVEEGVPLEPALRRIAADARLRQRRAAEEAARRVPVRLLFPLVACTLPAFVVLTVVPLLVVGLASLDL